MKLVILKLFSVIKLIDLFKLLDLENVKSKNYKSRIIKSKDFQTIEK